MKHFHALYASLYSRDLYRDVAANWKGIGLLYLLLLLALTWAPSAIRWHTALRHFVRTSGAQMAERLPAISIRNGEMRATPSGRHDVRDSETGETFLIIDDRLERVPDDITVQTMVLTRREFGIVNPHRNERRVFALAPNVTLEVTAQKAQRFLEGLPILVAPVLYLVCVGGSFVFRALQALLYAQIAMFFARRLKLSLDDKAAIRLAAVAITPVVLARTAWWFAPSEPAWYYRWPVAFIITLGCLRFAVRAVAESRVESQTPAAPPSVVGL